MLAQEVKNRVNEQIKLIEKKLDDIDNYIKQNKNESATYWLFTIYENIAEAIQDIKDNKKDFRGVKNHALKIAILRLNTSDTNYADCLEKLNKAKNIGAYGKYADNNYSAPISATDLSDCLNRGKTLLGELKQMLKDALTKQRKR